jgi:NADPH:quinone reductase-like Zn-dependent oxidoreductase
MFKFIDFQDLNPNTKPRRIAMSDRKNNLEASEQTMKAVICKKYGSPDALQLMNTEKPRPKDNEVLIRIQAASLNAYDWHLLRASPFFTRFSAGLFKPRNRIPGADIAGIVESVGKTATQFKIGDEVYGCLESCGAGGLAAGGFAEYVCARETVLALKPTGASFEEAAALPMAAVTALQGLRDKGQIKPGQRVLINGASGGVGTFAVQIAKSFGFEVTGVCSKNNLDMVHSIGADHVIDYGKEDFSKTNQQYDLILDIAANHSIADYRRALSPNGICVVVGFTTMAHMIQVALSGLSSSKAGGKKIIILAANNTNRNDLIFINRLFETGKVKPVIDRYYLLSEAADAFRYVETKHASGKVVIKITH